MDPVGTNPTQGSPASQLSWEFLSFVKFCKSLFHCSLARAFGWAGRQAGQAGGGGGEGWWGKLSLKGELGATLMCQKTGGCHSKCETFNQMPQKLWKPVLICFNGRELRGLVSERRQELWLVTPKHLYFSWHFSTRIQFLWSCHWRKQRRVKFC